MTVCSVNEWRNPVTRSPQTPKWIALAALLFLGLPLSAQEEQPRTQLTRPPWNGDWLQARLDQMVSGEEFLGYPGPLVKFYAAFGMDPKHPGTEHDRLVLVERDAPFWFGNCNGWAAATMLYEEPQSVVVNGIKFFSGETKAITSRPWKDTVEIRLGENDSRGLSAKSFHELLRDYIGQDRPIIFDVTVGLESWNYPVAGHTSDVVSEDADWVYIKTRVFYTDTRILSRMRADNQELVYLTYDYEYRYSKTEPVVYEWVNNSQQPDRAWLPSAPYIPRVWFMFANRYWNETDVNAMNALAQELNPLEDLYEPNNSVASSFALDQQLALAAVYDQDRDWYRLEKTAGELLDLNFKVYDGPRVSLNVYDAQENLLISHESVSDIQLMIPDHVEGPLSIEIAGLGSSEPSFYHLQRFREYSWYRLEQSVPQDNTRLTAVNLSEGPLTVISNETQELPNLGATTFENINTNTLYRAEGKVTWAVEREMEDGPWKRYFQTSAKGIGYEVPHITCRNNWHTLMTAQPEYLEPVPMEVYDDQGNMLESVVLPADEIGGVINLADKLTPATVDKAAWFKLNPSPDNVLSGFVSFINEGGYRADYNLGSQPRNGQQSLSAIPAPGDGWIGLSLLNTSGVENEVLLRLRNSTGAIVEEGRMVLAPGQRWLGLPQTLFASPIEANYSVAFFSQFSLESLVLRRHVADGLDFAHRLDGLVLDHGRETVVTVPQSGAENHTYMLTNFNNQSNWVVFRGYNTAGEEVATLRYENRSVRRYETRIFTLADLLTDGEIDPETNDIAYFLVQSQRPLALSELIGTPGSPRKTFVKTWPNHIYP